MIKILAKKKKKNLGNKNVCRSLSQFTAMESRGGTQVRNLETRTESDTSEGSSVSSFIGSRTIFPREEIRRVGLALLY